MAKALLGGLSAILVVAVVVGVVATVTRSGKKAGDNFTVPGEASLATSGKSVKSLCAPTLYKESCEKTLSQATNGTENPKEFSRLVIMESTIADFVKPEGYMPWNGDFALKTLYYAEYNNRGPGAGTSKRVNWPGFHVIGRKEAEPFTAGPFIDGAMWLKYTGAPHILGFKF
ncbi:pectin methylesterase1 [Zea mays]|uniref:Pectin methylesterase1 n=1 Tax=Zea mays TaxID=4577 RepID=A0A1D6J7X3_MAIZE|nr:pectin methylesterase1 [Zea mays]